MSVSSRIGNAQDGSAVEISGRGRLATLDPRPRQARKWFGTADQCDTVDLLGVGASAATAADWRVNNFDLIRLLAALQVATIHSLAAFHMYGVNATVVSLAVRMFPGVPIFFVISGFLISKSYERCHSLRDFYRNRCLRIFPALWVCLAASIGVILIAGVGGLGPVSARAWLGWWGAQMSLYQQYGPDFLRPIGQGSLNANLWTIPVELEFYLVLPLIYAVFRLRERRGDIALGCLLLASVALHFVYCRPSLWPAYPPHTFVVETAAPYLWIFLTGVLMQRHWPLLRGWLAGSTHWWLLGYVLLCVVCRRLHIAVGSADISPLFLLPLAALVLSFALWRPALADKLLRRNDVSYGTYIYQALVLNLMLLFGVQGGLLSVAAAIGISLGLGALSWWFVERPFLHRKRKSLRAAMLASPLTQQRPETGRAVAVGL